MLVGMKYELVEWFGINLALHGCEFKPWEDQNLTLSFYFANVRLDGVGRFKGKP